MITEKERKNRDKLFGLMRENPDLPVIPFVDGEIVGSDEWGLWMGSWGNSRVDEYIIPKNDYEPVIFRSDNDIQGTLESCLTDEEFDLKADSDLQQEYDRLPWKRAIIVYIELPEYNEIE